MLHKRQSACAQIAVRHSYFAASVLEGVDHGKLSYANVKIIDADLGQAFVLGRVVSGAGRSFLIVSGTAPNL